MSKRLLFILFFFLTISSSGLFGQAGSIPTGTDPNCSKAISVFQKAYSGTKDDYGLSVMAMPDSGYVVAGWTNSFGNGGYDGLLSRMDKRGNILWSKAFGGSGYDVFYNVKLTADGGLIAVGQTKSFGNTAGDGWLLKTDASGNVQWSKKYGDGNVNGEIAYDVIQLSDGGYAFSGSHAFAPGSAQGSITRTDGSGVVIWSKHFGMSGSDQLSGILEDGNSIVVSGFYQGFSFYDGYVMKLDKSNGTIQWMRGYDAENRSTWFGKLTKTNTGYQAFSVITDDYVATNQQVCIWNLNTDGTLQQVRKLSVTGVWTDSRGTVTLPDGGFVSTNSQINSSTADVILCHVNASGNMVWSKTYPRAGKQGITAIAAMPGGYLGVGYNSNNPAVPDSNNLFVLRTDNLGDAGLTCGTTNSNDLNVVIPSYSTPVPPISDFGAINNINPVITVGVVNVAPATTTFCSACKVPTLSGTGNGTGSNTTCTNGFPVYQMAYGGNKDEVGYGMTPTNDSGYVVSGQTNSFGNGGYDAWLSKINKHGNVVWSKTYGGSNNDLFYSVKQTTDNGYIAVGQTRSYGNTAGDALLVKTDAGGNVQWSRKYGNGNVNGEIAYEVIQLSDGGFAFVGVHQFSGGVAQSFVVRTDNLGVVIWSKQYGNGASDALLGLVEDGNSLVTAGYYHGGSFYDGYVMKLDKANGAIQWTRGYDAENRSIWAGRIYKTNNGYQVWSILSDDFSFNNEQQCIWNLNSDGTVQNARKLVIPGTVTISSGIYTFPDGGFLATNSENNNNSDIILCKINASGGLDWSKKYAAAGKQSSTTIVASLGGGYATMGYTSNAPQIADSTNMFLMRTDNLGNTAGTCNGVNTNDLTVVTPTYSSPVPNIVDLGTVAIVNPVITIGVNNVAPAATAICSSCLSGPGGGDTTCAIGTAVFRKTYGGNKDDIGYNIASTPDSGYVIAGQTNTFGNGGYDGLIQKMNRNGSLVWSKAIGGSGYEIFYTIKQTSDNGFIAVGQTKSYGNPAGDAWLVKTDASGNVQWSKKYGDGNVNGDIAYDVVQLSDGGYAFTGSHNFAPGAAEGFVVRTDNQGVVIWAKQFGMGGSDQLGSILEDGNSLVVTGFYQGGSFYDGYVMKLDKSSGAIQWKQGFDGEGRSTWMSRISKTTTGYQVFSLITDDYGATNQQQCIWNLNADGTLQNVRKLVIPGIWTNNFGLYALGDGGFVTANGENNIGSDLILSKVNGSGTIVWSKKFLVAGKQYISSITATPGAGYAMTGSNNNDGILPDSNNVYLVRVDSEGNAGSCSGVNTTDLSVVVPSFTTPVPTPVDLGNVTINNPVITVGVVSFVPDVKTQCLHCIISPTGSRQPITSTTDRSPHVLKVYPNPVVGGSVNVSINAAYEDRVVISLVDLSGNVIQTLPGKYIQKGNNIIAMNIPLRIQSYTNYLVQVKYLDHADAVKIFVINKL